MNRIARALNPSLSALRVAVLAAAGLAAAAPAVSSAGTEIFDFEVPNQPARPEVVPAPVLNDRNVDEVRSFFQARRTLDPNATLAVKIFERINNPAAIDLFNQFQVNYVFADYETNPSSGGPSMGDAKKLTRDLANQLDNTSSWRRLEYGNFEFRAGDSRTNMHNLALYPGAPWLEEVSGPNSSKPKPFTSPNIRSGLFAAPIQRFADLTNKRLQHTNIPYVTRFNNWLNPKYDNVGTTADGFQFQTTDQLLSRGDFSSQVLHYRMRGADTIHLFEPGVVGYTKQQMQDDAIAGWNLQQVQDVFADEDFELAYLGEEIGVGRKDEQDLTEGVVYSGVYTEGEKLFVLVSNLTDEARDDIRLDPVDKVTVGGEDDDRYFVSIGPNDHLLFEFDYTEFGKKKRWVPVGDPTPVFVDDERGGIGIPEPAAVGLLALAAPLLARRRRAAHGG